MNLLTASKFLLAVASCLCLFSMTPFAITNVVAAQTDLTQTGSTQTGSTQSDAAPSSTDVPRIPEPLDTYMGRRIAQTMHYEGAEWLIRDAREQEERCSLMLTNLGIKPGMVICDMGCGNGFYSLQMAQLTGKKGYVVGVDVQPEMLKMLRDRMEEQGIDNVIPILGSFHDPRLPRDLIDLILLVDVYHEFSHPEPMLAAMRASLKPDGVIVLVEYRAEDPEVPIKRLHKMSKAQIHKEMNANGFAMVKEFDKLPWQHMMFFGKTKPENKPDAKDESKPKEKTEPKGTQ